MSFSKSPFEKGKQSSAQSQEYRLLVESPPFGPIGEAKLQAIITDVQQHLTDRYGPLIKGGQPFITLNSGVIHLGIETEKITHDQAEEISLFVRRCFEEYKQ